jgi:hypothetical protein
LRIKKEKLGKDWEWELIFFPMEKSIIYKYRVGYFTEKNNLNQCPAFILWNFTIGLKFQVSFSVMFTEFVEPLCRNSNKQSTSKFCRKYPK